MLLHVEKLNRYSRDSKLRLLAKLCYLGIHSIIKNDLVTDADAEILSTSYFVSRNHNCPDLAHFLRRFSEPGFHKPLQIKLCSKIFSGKISYHLKTSQLIYNVN